MPLRHRHRPGRYLMRSDHNGLIYYDDEMVQLYNGLWVHHTEYETRHPQEFVYARDDPKALRHVRTDGILPTPNNNPSGFIGETTVQTPTSPAGHIFRDNVGIGEMVVGGTNTNTVFEVS